MRSIPNDGSTTLGTNVSCGRGGARDLSLRSCTKGLKRQRLAEAAHF
jgi:hypothetical protein